MQMSFLKNNKLLKGYDLIRTSFWFVPCLIIFLTLALCGLLIWLDTLMGLKELPWLHFLYYANSDITRDLLITVASSVMTVVSITFSITIVALTNASSQFGPRLLRNFMNDSSTQTVLGTFVAIFLYCLVLVRVTDNFAQGAYLPGLALGGAMLLTFISIFVLIYFIHHIATNLQADNIIDKVYDTLQENIRHIFSEHRDNESGQGCLEDVRAQIDKHFNAIKAQHSGYVQAINYVSLTQLMANGEQCMELLVSPGDFVTKRMTIIKCSGQEVAAQQYEQLLACITLGAKRTPIQDPEFAIMQLVEIALRALSPSINDPYSGIACIDKLSATLCNLTHQTFPTGVACDSNGQPRLVFKTATFQGLANTAYDQIRQNSRSNLAVQLRLLEGLIRTAEQASLREHWQFIAQQQLLLEHDLQHQALVGNDEAEMLYRLDQLKRLISRSGVSPTALTLS